MITKNFYKSQMKFDAPLLRGILIKRYKRFLADIKLETGEVITAHCPNSGALRDFTDPGLEVYVSKEAKSNRKLLYSWQMARKDGIFVGVNTHLPNVLVLEALQNHKIEALKEYSHIRQEVPYDRNSRIDFLLQTEESQLCYVEVKNVHWRRGERAFFPDSVTQRGAKHLDALMRMVDLGHRAVVIYVVQRQDCTSVATAADVDSCYAQKAIEARSKGVEFLAYACFLDETEIRLDQPLLYVN